MPTKALRKARTQTRRLHNPNSDEHFCTDSAEQQDGLVTLAWNDADKAWAVPKTLSASAFVYNVNAGDRRYALYAVVANVPTTRP